ncbi:hypothetical protein SAMN05216480_101236 [Pustulibacterium marinum]|uniref:Outer membrane protein beta-barrel domain-containing protein n=1 Tax=Pustulibacterium marinum TaxID=1224947 RepID=A0A1I7EUJ8_9FLAO|nr:hypothetical protein [Pustulibacterium marinum]SFU27605.1 hypothetical protein SAMN05216480_101236 [Pustulibacterium marinum]
MKGHLVFLVGLFCMFFSNAQEEKIEHHALKNSLRVSVGIGHSYIKKGIDGENYGISMATFYADGDYWFSNKFAAGLQTEIILEDFLVEHHSEDEHIQKLERSNPIAVVPVMLYTPIKNVMLVGGYGVDFCENETFTMVRTGIEYGVHFSNDWEVGTSLIYDFKTDAYDAWVFGVGISKFFNFSSDHAHGLASAE